MIDAAAIRAGAGRTFRTAPSAATFLTLTWAVLATTDVLIRTWEQCGGTKQLASMNWRARAIAYRDRVLKERDAARALVDHIATGNLDWQAAALKGGAYATALGLFLNGPTADSGGWAELSNELEELGCEPPPSPSVAGEISKGLKWLNGLIFPWNAAAEEALTYVAETTIDEENPLTKMHADALAAVKKYFTDPLEYIEKAKSNLAMVAAIGIGLWFGWPLIAPIFGFAQKRTGEGA